MEEVTCPCCGAIFTPENSAGICPNCGYDARTLFAKLRLLDKDMLGIAAFLVFSLLVIHNLIFALIAVAMACFAFAQRARIGLHKPAIALNLEAREPKKALIPISKPPTPKEWKTLASLSRPRVVVISARAKGEVILSAVVFLGVGAFVLSSYWNRFETLAEHPQGSIFGLVWLGLFVYLGAIGVRDWFAAWEVLRDGELTTGILTDWREGRGGASISYQYWTDSGQRFERHGKLVSKEELATKEDPLKVFYLPQEPTKSVALCCTSLRVRMS
jgi:hypothetical protein